MRKHAGQYRFHCKICKKGFMKKGHYEGHMNMHDNKRPYLCHICHKGFGVKTNAQQHLRNVHGLYGVEVYTWKEGLTGKIKPK